MPTKRRQLDRRETIKLPPYSFSLSSSSAAVMCSGDISICSAEIILFALLCEFDLLLTFSVKMMFLSYVPGWSPTCTRWSTWQSMEIRRLPGRLGVDGAGSNKFKRTFVKLLNVFLAWLLCIVSRCDLVTYLSHLLLVLNSSSNIVIYCWKDDKFRKVFYMKEWLK